MKVPTIRSSMTTVNPSRGGRSIGQSGEIFRVRAAGGPVESTGLRGPILVDLDISPDGSRILVRWGTVNTREIWALENFLPR